MLLRRVIAPVVAPVLSVLLFASAATAEDPIFLNWSTLAPGLTAGYDPTSANECKAGKIQCVDALIREMDRRFQRLLETCDHNSMFSLGYMRTTEEYRRAVLEPGFFSDTGFMNHYDAVFASYYFDQIDAYRAGRLGDVSAAWKLAFDTAAAKTATGTGDFLLGMNAHINRDLPYVIWEIGLVGPDGISRKADHDKVNEFLNRVSFTAEAQRRLDPDMSLDTNIPGGMQLIVGWRERAWRNAERLRAAENDPLAFAVVKQSIETDAYLEGLALKASYSYGPFESSAARDAHCMAHRYDV